MLSIYTLNTQLSLINSDWVIWPAFSSHSSSNLKTDSLTDSLMYNPCIIERIYND